MIKLLSKINEGIITGFRTVAVVCMIAIIVSTSVQVFTRYVLGAALIGTEEVARYCFIWASMLGASICVRRFSHATVSFLPDNLRGKIKTGHSYLIQLLIAVVGIVLIVQGINMLGITLKQLSPTLKVPMWLVYLAIPVGGAGILLNSLLNIADMGRKSEKGVEA